MSAVPELLGYVASILVAASLTMSNIRRLRWVNLAGAVAFTVYGGVIGAWPVFAVNFFVAGVDVYHLARLARRSDFFTLLPVAADDALLRKFLRFHAGDIARFFPAFAVEAPAGREAVFVLRNMVPVGVFCWSRAGAGELEVDLDYVVPEYRDHRNAEFLYRILNERFGAEGCTSFVVRTDVPTHARYLRRQGFAAEGEGGRYRKAII